MAAAAADEATADVVPYVRGTVCVGEDWSRRLVYTATCSSCTEAVAATGRQMFSTGAGEGFVVKCASCGARSRMLFPAPLHPVPRHLEPPEK